MNTRQEINDIDDRRDASQLPIRRRLMRPQGARPTPPSSAAGAGPSTPDRASIEADIRELERQARRAGFEQGRQEGLLKADAELQDMRRHMSDQLAMDLAQQRKALEALHEQEILTLRNFAGELQCLARVAQDAAAIEAIALAHAGLCYVLQTQTTPRHRVELALEHVKAEIAPLLPLKVWLNPQDLALLAPELHGDASIALLADPGMVRGSCRAEHAHGEVESQMHQRVHATHALWVNAATTLKRHLDEQGGE